MIQFAPGLPKTRSGKIMRRILRKIAEDDLSNLGDTSTLADPAVVDDLVQNRAGRRRRRGDPVRRPQPVLRGDRGGAGAAQRRGRGRGGGRARRGAGARRSGHSSPPEPDVTATDVLGADLKGWLRREIGAHAVPQVVQFGPAAEVPRRRDRAAGAEADRRDRRGRRRLRPGRSAVVAALAKARADALAEHERSQQVA